jgi:hypothetical protein
MWILSNPIAHLSKPSRRRWNRLWSLPLASAIVLATGAIGSAAETIILRYGVLGGSLPVTDLTNWVDRGELSDDLETYLLLSQQKPDKIRRLLSQSVPVSADWLDLSLRTDPGRTLLSAVGQVLQSPQSRDSAESLKTALLAAARDDGQLSLLEVLQDYPARELHVQVDRLNKLADTWQRLRGGAWLDRVKP